MVYTFLLILYNLSRAIQFGLNNILFVPVHVNTNIYTTSNVPGSDGKLHVEAYTGHFLECSLSLNVHAG